MEIYVGNGFLWLIDPKININISAGLSNYAYMNVENVINLENY
jgi:hypothetical protein